LTLTAEFSVEAALDAHVAALVEVREPDGAYHPSQMFICERRATYSVRATPESNPPGPRTHRVFRVGHEFHRFAQQALSFSAGKGNTAFVYHEVALHSPRLNLRGSADSIRFYMDEEADELLVEVIEYKSIKEASLRYAKELPKLDHVSQALTYAYLLRHEPWWTPTEADPEILEFHKPLGNRLLQVRICYISKDDLNVREFLVPVTEAWERELERYIARLDMYRLDEVALPPRLPIVNGKKHWACGYCPWADKCWLVDSEGIELA
jgi:CRISPR/Cas system-associated exonuclease Cas4 (RecB family)